MPADADGDEEQRGRHRDADPEVRACEQRDPLAASMASVQLTAAT